MTKVGIIGGMCNASHVLAVEDNPVRGASGRAVPVVNPRSGQPEATGPAQLPVLP